MKPKTLSILKKIYHHKNGYYYVAHDRHEHRIPGNISQKELILLKEDGLAPNSFETISHDDALVRLIKIFSLKQITLEIAAAFFLKGLSGEMPRGRQILLSYLYIHHLYKHDFVGRDTCRICGLPKVKTEDKTNVLFSYYLGHCWNELPLHFLIELEESKTFEPPISQRADRLRLLDLLNFIAEANPAETPGLLEKRIAKNKVLPKTDKYKRYGILMTLAECGILPNAFIPSKYDVFTASRDIEIAGQKLSTSHRSDIILPLAGWRGRLGVDFNRAVAVFGPLE